MASNGKHLAQPSPAGLFALYVEGSAGQAGPSSDPEGSFDSPSARVTMCCEASTLANELSSLVPLAILPTDRVLADYGMFGRIEIDLSN